MKADKKKHIIEYIINEHRRLKSSIHNRIDRTLELIEYTPFSMLKRLDVKPTEYRELVTLVDREYYKIERWNEKMKPNNQ